MALPEGRCRYWPEEAEHVVRVGVRSLARWLLRGWPQVVRNRVIARAHASEIDVSCRIARGAEVLQSKLAYRACVAAYGSVRRSRIGKYSSVGRFTKVADSQLGAFCSISWDCTIGAHRHWLDHATSHQFPFVLSATFRGETRARQHDLWRSNTAGVVLGNDVWVGANSVILDGVKVGHGSVVAAGSVVSRSIKPYAIVGGVPAVTLRRRFKDDICDALLRIRWWDWPDDLLVRHIELFQVPVTEEVVERLEDVCASLEAR